MRQSATVTSKGQVTIPREIRRRLETGDRVDFVIEDGRNVICRSRAETNPFAVYAGALPAFTSKRAVNSWLANLGNNRLA